MTELGLTQEDIKKPLKVKTRGAVGHYLGGRRDPTPDQLVALALTLKMSLDELLLPDTGFRGLKESPHYWRGLAPSAEFVQSWTRLSKKTQQHITALVIELAQQNPSKRVA